MKTIFLSAILLFSVQGMAQSPLTAKDAAEAFEKLQTQQAQIKTKSEELNKRIMNDSFSEWFRKGASLGPYCTVVDSVWKEVSKQRILQVRIEQQINNKPKKNFTVAFKENSKIEMDATSSIIIVKVNPGKGSKDTEAVVTLSPYSNEVEQYYGKVAGGDATVFCDLEEN
jgi:hypothetical protein